LTDAGFFEDGPYKTDIWDKAAIARPAGSPYRVFVEAMEPKVRAMVERSARDPAEVARRILARATGIHAVAPLVASGDTPPPS
jgi:hypothetical protein